MKKSYYAKHVYNHSKNIISHNDHEAQPWGGPKADENGGAGAEPPLKSTFF